MTSYQKVRMALVRVEESPWTRNWRHLDPIPSKAWNTRINRSFKAPTPAPPQDRIKQWNIVPGDRIRVIGDQNGTIMEVLGINKLRNRVFLKTPSPPPDGGPLPEPPSVAYRQCQLYIGDREFPPAPGETTPQVLPVFARRIRCTAPQFVVPLGRFDWERFAVQTTPRIGDRGEKIKISIPWPNPEPITPRPIEAYDTPEDVVKKITWRPSPIYYPPSTHAKAKHLQDTYLHSIRPPPSTLPGLEYDPTTSTPIEYVLHDELSNPHSRARKQFRARKRRGEHELAHKRFLETELTDLDDRSRKEALAEAEWKWKEHVRKEDRERKKTQWVLRGGAADLKRKRQRRARKARRELNKLKGLKLEPALNQVLPGTSPET